MARCMRTRYPDVTWWCPQLPASPAQTMVLLQEGTAAWPREQMAVVGSSLGGFYAAWLSAHWGCPAVLLNPAVHPSRDLSRYIGEHPVWQDPSQRIFFEPAYVQELMRLESQPMPTQPVTLALIAQGDEVLDWREMLTRHQGGQVRLIEGSDHALSDFSQYLPQILEFLELA